MGQIRKFLEVLILTIAFGLLILPTVSAPLAVVMPAQTAAQDALNQAIDAPNSPFPAGTKILGVQVVEGLATVNFSHELRDNFHGGDTEEANAVTTILKAAGQSPEVRRVQILVEGRPIDSLGGLIDVSQPLAVVQTAGIAPEGHRYLHRRLMVPKATTPPHVSRT